MLLKLKAPEAAGAGGLVTDPPKLNAPPVFAAGGGWEGLEAAAPPPKLKTPAC